MSKASAKRNEEAARLRYVRILERFSKSITVYLFKSETLSKDEYDKRIDKHRRYLEKTEAAPLYKAEYGELEAIVQQMILYREKATPIEEIREDLLYRMNQLEKSANRRRYKKDKHGSNAYDGWE